ncbi:sigma-54-dependent Fis family transcriptional regulator [Bacillus piscicola]|uniref:sigma-54-dependent Fis family transcriptional regulator n=1 Tax=Bacillus piscicola TaxID=1632684 RepID=UPI001F09B005|nr:sigma-54-dependent Fis family transcriptional regulator [Bacillus piscicola]
MITINRNNIRSEFIQSSESISTIKNAKEAYIEKGKQPDIPFRSEILLSWERSKNFGVNPFQKQVNKNVKTTELLDSQERNEKLLHFARQDMQHLIQSIGDSRTIITISDKDGLLLDAYGHLNIKKKAGEINFLPGAVWNEETAGTNAIGTVIKNKLPIHIFFTEHFSEGWQDWFCAAAPIFHPFTNELMGVLDLSGKWKNINSHTLGLAISKANNISRRIEGLLYREGLEMNPLLKTLLGSMDDGVMLVDENRNVLKVNEKMESILTGINKNKKIADYPEIEKLVNLILLKKTQSVVEEEISIHNGKGKYILTAQPVSMDTNRMLGIFIRLRPSIQKSQIKQSKILNRHQPAARSTEYTFENMIGSSNSFVKVIEKAKKAASLQSTLLLNGETGTGKEWFAQAIHNHSERSDNPFIALNCGAIPRELVESELFGYEHGAFTGAKQKGQLGKFELANGGTIFLDEIGDMPLNVQVHLLRVLEERTVTRIGGNSPTPVDVRVIAATHRNLTEAVQNGTFREDLLYRLRVIQLQIPSLHERMEDIPLLIHHYIHELSSSFDKKNVEIDPTAMKYLQSYSWPGNIREIKNVVEQLLFNMEGTSILPCDIPPEIHRTQETESEKNNLVQAIRSSKGNVTQAAERLGISRATMYRKMKKFGVAANQD